MKNIVLVGAAGHQGMEYFTILHPIFNIVALVDTDLELLKQKYAAYNVPIYNNIEDIDIDYDVAIVCVPHYYHKDVTIGLIARNKIVIQEKPLAITAKEVECYRSAMNINNNCNLFTIVQRSFNPIFCEAKQDLRYIGAVYSYQYIYNLCIPTQTTGWRAVREQSYGGVLLDMGYHALDIIISFFSKPISTSAVESYCYESMQRQQLEDSISIVMQHERGISGAITLNRHSSTKEEVFTIYGSQGSMTISPTEYAIYDRHGQEVKRVVCSSSSEQIKLKMIVSYIDAINNLEFCASHFEHHNHIVNTIDDIYRYTKRNIYKAAA